MSFHTNIHQQLVTLIVIILLCIFSGCSDSPTKTIVDQNGPPGWFVQNVDQQENALFGLSFTDINRGTAVGDSGIILRTINGGATWSAQNSSTTQNLYGVSFSDANNGTAVGDSGIILRTINGGTTWTTQNSNTTFGLSDVCFTDIKIGAIIDFP